MPSTPSATNPLPRTLLPRTLSHRTDDLGDIVVGSSKSKITTKPDETIVRALVVAAVPRAAGLRVQRLAAQPVDGDIRHLAPPVIDPERVTPIRNS